MRAPGVIWLATALLEREIVRERERERERERKRASECQSERVSAHTNACTTYQGVAYFKVTPCPEKLHLKFHTLPH